MAKKTKTEKVLNLIKKKGGLTFKQINKQVDAKTFLYGTGKVNGLLNRFVKRAGDVFVAVKYPPDEVFYTKKTTSQTTDSSYNF